MQKQIKKLNKKIPAVGLILSCLITEAMLIKTEILAAEPTVTVDETAYATLDYYGRVSSVSVVKACDLNGNLSFSDYGDYEAVKNMTTLDQPALSQEGIKWQFKQENVPRRFYYQVTPKNQSLNLPWTIDVSYSLNGVPMKAADLAGKSGLVAIDVKVTPNPLVEKYFQNNFVLTAGVMVDNNKNLSFTASGAQMQTFGNYQIAFFMAMPQEATTFHFEIGTESFENEGVMLAMVPATIKQLDQMSEVREHKSNLENAGKAIDNTFDDIFTIMTAMTGGMNKTVTGLTQLDETRAALYQAKDENDKATNSIVSSVNDLTDKVNAVDNIQTDQTYQLANQYFGDNLWMKRANQALAVGDSSKGMINNMSTFANAMKKTVDNNSDSLNEGAKQTLQGVSEMMTNMSAAMSKTADLQKNKNTIAKITKDEWRRLDDKLHIIDINTQADKVSLTSAKNISPRSLQVILRTQEITIESTQSASLSASVDEEINFVSRLKVVLGKMGEMFTNWSR